MLLSPVAATGIKLSHIFRMSRGVKNRSARVVGRAVGGWLCTVIIDHPMALKSLVCKETQKSIFLAPIFANLKFPSCVCKMCEGL